MSISLTFEENRKKFLHFFALSEKIIKMQENSEEVLKEFGKRVQRCYGCYVSYYLKDMYLGEDVTFFCEHCKDDSMFHFDDFSRLLDVSKLREIADDHHH